MLKECGFQSPEVWGQHVPLKTPWARLSKPLVWARVSPQNRASRELEILGSGENQGKVFWSNSPSLHAGKHEGHFPASLPCLLAQPWPQAGTAPLGKMCPGGSGAQPCSAWHTALPHPPGREGKSMDMRTIWSWGFFQGSTERFVQLPELFSPSLSLPLDSWDVNTAACAVSLLPHICTRGKSSTYRIAIRTGFFRGTSPPTFSSSWSGHQWGWTVSSSFKKPITWIHVLLEIWLAEGNDQSAQNTRQFIPSFMH